MASTAHHLLAAAHAEALTKASSNTKRPIIRTSPKPAPYRTLAHHLHTLAYHLHTLYLFTADDIPAVALPQTAFGLIAALSGPALTTATTSPPSILPILARTPLVLLWTWLHLLVFTVANQRLPGAAREDRLNKPHRPLAAGRLTPDAARRLLLVLGPLVYLISRALGAGPEGLALFALTWACNDLGAGDDHHLARNAVNALGITCFGAGAAAVALGGAGAGVARNVTFTAWCAVLAAIIQTTVQAQDLRDAAGDRARGRPTLPIVWGDAAARWSVAVPVALWSVFCPAWWGVGLVGWAVAVGGGALLAGRMLMLRSPKADRLTWKVWALWMAGLYALPLLA